MGMGVWMGMGTGMGLVTAAAWGACTYAMCRSPGHNVARLPAFTRSGRLSLGSSSVLTHAGGAGHGPAGAAPLEPAHGRSNRHCHQPDELLHVRALRMLSWWMPLWWVLTVRAVGSATGMWRTALHPSAGSLAGVNMAAHRLHLPT